MNKWLRLLLVFFFLFGFLFLANKEVKAGCLSLDTPEPTSGINWLPSIGDTITVRTRIFNGCATLYEGTDKQGKIDVFFSIDGGNQSFYIQPATQNVFEAIGSLKYGKYYNFTTTIKAGNTCSTSQATNALAQLRSGVTLEGARSEDVGVSGGVGSTIKGTIYKSDGSPAGGATVTISPADNSGGSTAADANGFYILKRIACTSNHTLTASLGSETVSKSLPSSTSDGGASLCNGQERTHNLTLPPPPPTTGTIQGYKVKMPGNVKEDVPPSINSPYNETVSLDSPATR